LFQDIYFLDQGYNLSLFNLTHINKSAIRFPLRIPFNQLLHSLELSLHHRNWFLHLSPVNHVLMFFYLFNRLSVVIHKSGFSTIILNYLHPVSFLNLRVFLSYLAFILFRLSFYNFWRVQFGYRYNLFALINKFSDLLCYLLIFRQHTFLTSSCCFI
jgi:hypothetical protein